MYMGRSSMCAANLEDTAFLRILVVYPTERLDKDIACRAYLPVNHSEHVPVEGFLYRLGYGVSNEPLWISFLQTIGYTY
mgnify:FL=1